jgi:hypothetical protein
VGVVDVGGGVLLDEGVPLAAVGAFAHPLGLRSAAVGAEE